MNVVEAKENRPLYFYKYSEKQPRRGDLQSTWVRDGNWLWLRVIVLVWLYKIFLTSLSPLEVDHLQEGGGRG